ncbi:MAG: L-histidine N(alpha)-methyltransferase [Candidatus Rokuibacteriota bacterium]
MGTYRAYVHDDEHARRKAMAADVLRGLTDRPKWLLPKYFYDAEGSRLFDDITRLPEYYLTRVEAALLDGLAPALMRGLRPRDIVEIGAGSSAKVRRLLAARDGVRPALRYTPIDVDEGTMAAAARRLLAANPEIDVHGLVGDFERHLVHVPAPLGRRLVLFFGSTIGNLDPPERHGLLASARQLLRRGDRLLLGVDLVKAVPVLEAAYNDGAGVTAAFNRNVLRVINHALGADFEPEAFRHHAPYNAAAGRIEMHLVATARQRVRVRSLDLTVWIERDETIWTESCYKFTRATVSAMLDAAGLRLQGWHTDEHEQFALVLAAPAPRAHRHRA